MTKDRLTRSRSNKWLAGICGGIAEYFGWNAEALRLVWLVLTVGTMFCGGIIYLNPMGHHAARLNPQIVNCKPSNCRSIWLT